MATPPPLPHQIDLTPTVNDWRVMRQVIAEHIQTYRTTSAQITALIQRLNDQPGPVCCAADVSAEESDWLQDGLQRLVQHKETSRTTLQGGLDAIDRCRTPAGGVR